MHCMSKHAVKQPSQVFLFEDVEKFGNTKSTAKAAGHTHNLRRKENICMQERDNESYEI